MKVVISDIKGLDRYRKNLGDIRKLAASIKKSGLLNPVILTKDNQLISGTRRIAAHVHNGSTVIDALAPPDLAGIMADLETERDNGATDYVLPLTLSELVYQADLLKEQRSGKRTVGFRIDVRLAAYFKISNRALWEISTIVHAADAQDATPQLRALRVEMETTGNITRAWKNFATTGALVLTDREYPTIDGLKEQRDALRSIALKMDAIRHFGPQIKGIHARMTEEEIAEFIVSLTAGRAALAKVINSLRKAQK